MSFQVSVDAYARFMGRFSTPLAATLIEVADAKAGAWWLDVGSGPGMLTEQVLRLAAPGKVVATDPVESSVAAVRGRLDLPAIVAVAEQLPFADGVFDVAAAQLVVHFMTDPEAGVREMARVIRPDGTVVLNVWDHASDAGPLAAFWRAVRELDPHADNESGRVGVQQGQLRALCETAGLVVDVDTAVSISVVHEGFDEWWEPFTLGVGPAGAYVQGLDSESRDALRERCRALQPTSRFSTTARAWTVKARRDSAQSGP